MDTDEILDFFCRTDHIPIDRGGSFEMALPAQPSVDFDDVRGMMLGLAIGDALGAPSEGINPKTRREKYGDIRAYQPNRQDERRVGIPTDDSQLAFWTLEQMLADDGFEPDAVAQRFCEGQIYGIGSSTRRFIGNYKDDDQAWFVAGVDSAGNGALMRIPPMLVPHVSRQTTLWADTALSAMITHRNSTSIAASLSFVRILWQLLHWSNAPKTTWWVDEFVAGARGVERDVSLTTRRGVSLDFEGSLWQFVDEYVKPAYDDDRTVKEVSEYWHSGAYLLETVPVALYILMCHARDPEEAILRAVRDTYDNDTIGAIVGAAVGALHGVDAFPDRWTENLTGRTRADDDGRMFELLDEAEAKWGE
jgi:ADP-ribosyl-[dinitrogen reductase] hydrolase